MGPNGQITYYYEDEGPPPTSPEPAVLASVQPPWDEAADRQRRQDERYDREMAEWRRDQSEQSSRQAREDLAAQDVARDLRQAQASRARQQELEFRNQRASRRQAVRQEAESRSLAEGRDQEVAATARHWRLLQDQHDRQAASFQP